MEKQKLTIKEADASAEHADLMESYVGGTRFSRAQVAEWAQSILDNHLSWLTVNQIHDVQHILYRSTGDGLLPSEK